jgi:nicotinamidase-related amidase
MSHCLVIIDVQQGTFAFGRPLYRGEEVLERIAGLLESPVSSRSFWELRIPNLVAS